MIVDINNIITRLPSRSRDDVIVHILTHDHPITPHDDLLGDKSINLRICPIKIPQVHTVLIILGHKLLITQPRLQTIRHIGEIDIDLMLVLYRTKSTQNSQHQLRTMLLKIICHIAHVELLFVAAILSPDQIYRRIHKLPLPHLLIKIRNHIFPHI